MNHDYAAGVAPGGSAPAAAGTVADDQIMAIWQALRANPDLDARYAMQAIDQLLDQSRVAPGTREMLAPAVPGVVPGSLVHRAVLASILRTLLDAGAR